MGKVSMRLISWLLGFMVFTEAGGGNLLSGDEVAVDVELALNPLSASRLVTECGLLATTVWVWCV